MDNASCLTLVTELKRLIENPSYRDYIMRNDVNSLLIFIDPKEYSEVVVREAVKCIYLLSKQAARNRYTRIKMKDTVGLLESLNKVQYTDEYPPDIKANAILAIKLLTNVNKTSVNSEDELLKRRTLQSNKQEKINFLSCNAKAKEVVLEIEGLNDQNSRQIIVDKLIKVKGVISLTFNMKMKRCFVRAKNDLSIDVLGKAVSSTQVMKARQVIKNKKGEEFTTAIYSPCLDLETPEYLDEESTVYSATPNKTTLSSHGIEVKQAYGWFANIVSSVNKNLYW